MKEKVTDPRIKSLAAEVAQGRQAELVEELIDTALRLGRDKAGIGDLKLFNRAMREMRYAAATFAVRSVSTPCATPRLTALTTAFSVAVTMLPSRPTPYTVVSCPMRSCT